jgi:RNA recognition motif-containing protein
MNFLKIDKEPFKTAKMKMKSNNSTTSNASSTSSGNSGHNSVDYKNMQNTANSADNNNNAHTISLWIGNVDPTVTEATLTQLFSPFGHLTNVRILPEKYCAFVNFRHRDEAAKAMQNLQVYPALYIIHHRFLESDFKLTYFQGKIGGRFAVVDQVSGKPQRSSAQLFSSQKRQY